MVKLSCSSDTISLCQNYRQLTYNRGFDQPQQNLTLPMSSMAATAAEYLRRLTSSYQQHTL